MDNTNGSMSFPMSVPQHPTTPARVAVSQSSSSSILLTTCVLAVVTVARFIYQWLHRSRTGLKEVPGLWGLPYFGRVHDLDLNAPGHSVNRWSKGFNGMFQTQLMGQTHLWISSPKIAHDLLSKRASNYSSRPEVAAIPGSNRSPQYLPLLGHNDHWRRHRKFFTMMLANTHNAHYHGYVELETKRFLHALLNHPEGYFNLNDQLCGRITSWLNYGRPDASSGLCQNAAAFIPQLGPAGSIINQYPFLAHIPTFMNPGKWPVIRRRKHEEKVFLNALRQAETDFANHEALPPNHASTYYAHKFASDHEHRKSSETRGTAYGFAPDDVEAAYAIGMLATVAIFTIGGPLNCFYLAMVLYPEWQEAARKEVDAVLGDKMIATQEDHPNMPLLRATIKEVVRWRPVVPLGVPRLVEEDDVYEGYIIKKGTTAHVIEQAISRDENVYPDAETFNPGRWLDPKSPVYKEPLTEHPTLMGYHGFGQGRRVCPGVPVTETELMAACSGLLSCFTLEKKRRTDGSVVEPDPWKMSTNPIGGALEFEFDLKKRGGQREERIKTLWEEAQTSRVWTHYADKLDQSMFD